ncbi:glycine zipper domain-containing protein [Hymenobacter sp. H14-R3]|uniref:glycine zipper domain-containing protein n=1 Tax=Hymenobacter sp. H14-R3 TaxID=3046308 RepID=UPI0024B91E82|nr:glycine zipper domain-containing protein [Hymenobacter sp. H14-R3]MDJ0366858.1 glycine zipper domain-containing protein [Hymenobacter sp. H14-R3]
MKRTSWLFLIPALLFGLLPGYRAQAQTEPQPRKGWSPQAKNAAIGGAAGILGGVLINGRNRKVGALIGGLAGAGAGYAIGKHTDNKQKAAAAAAAQAAAAREQAAADAQAAASERAAAASERTAARASATERAAASKRTAAARASAQAAASRATAARTAAAQAAANRAAAERRLAAEQRAEASQAKGIAPAVADLAVASGYFPNPGFEQAGAPYPASAVLRKSW